MEGDSIVLYIIISILVSLLLALGVVWFLNQAQKKITKSRLKEQELKLEFQKKMLENTVRIKEQERKRISIELHDDVSSQLGIMNLNMHVLKKKMPEGHGLADIIDQIEMSIKRSSERSRAISHELMPISFKKFGLHQALEELADSINVTGVLSIEIDNDYLILHKDDFKLLHIYRVIQELVNNTVKYAKAKNIAINFSPDSEGLIMTYSDDGVGCDLTIIKAGLGLNNIKARASLLEGAIEFESELNNGFQAVLKFPNHE